ncbi:MAG: glycosyltransferase family 2 protein [Bacteroidota bacterium]
MTPLSVIVITRNEERNIVACLESVQWADDIIVVDAESADGTVTLARRFTQKIFIEPWKSFSEAKEFAVTKSNHEWILWLDADERMTPELAAEIQLLLESSPSKAAYSVARRAFFLGRWIKHSGWYPGRVARLFRKDRASFSSAAVHEGLNVQGPVGELRNDLLHFTDPNLYHYMVKFNRYTTLASKESFDAEKRFRGIDLLVRPPWLFFRMYIVRLGFLDGVPGLLLALLSSAYVFTKYAKLWEAWNSTVA